MLMRAYPLFCIRSKLFYSEICFTFDILVIAFYGKSITLRIIMNTRFLGNVSPF